MNKVKFQISAKRDYWEGQLQQYEASGLSKAAYCREHNLNYDQFKWWYRQLRDEDEHKSSPFVALAHTVTNTTNPRVEVASHFLF
ncbi:MAG TPA: hypothetical protein PKX79_11060 [Spirochaetota bacterium]|nr:hypothetical protein [Spirochaetota bacterium]HPP95903.1 hypothetical protein [Spirochaetota bacterium]